MILSTDVGQGTSETSWEVSGVGHKKASGTKWSHKAIRKGEETSSSGNNDASMILMIMRMIMMMMMVLMMMTM